MDKTSLNIRDYITIGVIMALEVVLYFTLGLAVGSTPLGFIFIFAVMAIPWGILHMLLYAKVPKKGVVLISNLILAILQFMNFWVIGLVMVIFSLVNEWIWRMGSQKKFSKMVLAFTVTVTGWFIGSTLPLLLLKDMYLAALPKYEQFYSETFNLIAGPLVIIALAATIAGCLVGAFLGRAMLKKHFEKAGIL